MAVLAELANELNVHERTLRRGLADGLLRGRRPTPRSVRLAPGEVRYVRRHWPLLAALRDVLRTERGVRLAVLIGSAARGELEDRSDVDVLVDALDPGWRAEDRLRERLRRATGRHVDLIALDTATQDPRLLVSALHDGRVLVDRDARWPSLVARGDEVGRSAARADGAQRRELHALLHELSHDA